MTWHRNRPVDGFREQRAGRLNVAVGGDPAAPTLVLVHGLGSTWRFWRPMLATLAERLQVVAVDAPGFGRSDRLGGDRYDLSLAAARIADALDELGIDDHAIAGHSFGGGLAARFALDHADRVRALALLAPAGFLVAGARASWSRPTLARLSNLVQRIGLPAVAASTQLRLAAFSRFVHDPSSLAVGDAMQLAYDATVSREGGRAGTAIVSAGLVAHAHELRMPTLVQWGEDDRIVGHRFAERLAGLLPDATLRSYPHAGHALPYEPDVGPQVARDLADFCAVLTKS